MLLCAGPTKLVHGMNVNSVLLPSDEPTQEEEAVEEVLKISYKGHIQSLGCTEDLAQGTALGNPNGKKRIEAFGIDGEASLGITYEAHVQGIGWQGKRGVGEIAGTEGESRRIEAFWIDLSPEVKVEYTILYRAYVEGVGWLPWAANGEKTGSIGFGRRIESMEVLLLPIEEAEEYEIQPKLLAELKLPVRAHVQRVGWVEGTTGGVLGTTGQSLRLEALDFKGFPEEVQWVHQSHISRIGWTEVLSKDQLSGTEGRQLALEALSLGLEGSLKEAYDVYYRVHVAKLGWLSWTKNASMAGTSGFGLRIEALEMRILPKEMPLVEVQDEKAKASLEPLEVRIQSHVASKGWLESVGDRAYSGQEEDGLNIEAFKVLGTGNPYVQVNYRVLFQGRDWSAKKKEQQVAGSTGKGWPLEAVEMELSGVLKEYYRLYYRSFITGEGWLPWSADGAPNGSRNQGKAIEAMEVRILPKNAKAPGKVTNPFLQKAVAKKTLVYYAKVQSSLFKSASQSSAIATIPKGTHLYGEVQGAWLITTYQGKEGFVSISDVSRHELMVAGQTILVNKKYGLPSGFGPGENPEARDALNRFLGQGRSEGLRLTITSAYRSYTSQQSLHQQYVSRYGRAYAEKISMRAGYSEHQTGLAYDIGIPGGSSNFSTSFGNTREGKWLAQNASSYGFILRYPKDKEHVTGINYEPWHFRYVGVALAKEIEKSGETLDEYFQVVGPSYSP